MDKILTKYQPGAVAEGKITELLPYGAMVALDEENTGFLHISEISYDYIQDIAKVLSPGQVIKVKIIGYDENHQKLNLSVKQLETSQKKRNAFKETIEENDVDASSLLKMLPKWIESQLKKEEKYD